MVQNVKELYSDKRGCLSCDKGEAKMIDRRGFVFPIMRTSDHRNLVFNSMPTYMADRQDALYGAGITDRHFIFTIESGDEVDGVIDAYKKNRAASTTVRRI